MSREARSIVRDQALEKNLQTITFSETHLERVSALETSLLHFVGNLNPSLEPLLQNEP